MNNLRRIGNHKKRGHDYLGLIGSFLFETLDDDRILQDLAPKYFKYWDSSQKRLFGLHARLILKDFRNESVIVIKSIAQSNAEIVAINGPQGCLSTHLIEDIKVLASHRWPKMTLTVRTSKIKKIHLKALSHFKKTGWIENPNTGLLQTLLFDK